MRRLFELLWMSMRESLVSGEIERIPEHLLVMDNADQVDAWHTYGDDDGPIAPIYHLNARACSRLVPKNGTVVDLGCGTGRYAAYLARLRPDLRIVGFDLSAPMVEVGNAALREAGLAARVELRIGDMTSFSHQLAEEVDLVCCVFALHHLPSIREVESCLSEIRGRYETSGAGFWVFDLVRPRHVRTVRDYPKLFTPDAREVFKDDSRNSLVAAYSHAELARAMKRVFGASTAQAACARLLPLYQAFWRDGSGRRVGPNKPSDVDFGAVGVDLSSQARSKYWQLRTILPQLPS